MKSSKPALLFSYHSFRQCRWPRFAVGVVEFESKKWDLWDLSCDIIFARLPWWHGWLPVKVFWSDNTHTRHTHTHTHTLMAFFFEAACVIRSLLSSNGKSGRPVFDCVVFLYLWVCVWESGSILTGSLHPSDVPDWGYIDFSIGSSSSARQSFYLTLSPV